MSEIKGIDVSRWNGSINWNKVSTDGVKFAILRITEKGNIIDSTFENNYAGCINNNIPAGVYKYSYATNIAQIKEEANVVVEILRKRKLQYPVFLDIEDKCQAALPSSLMMQMIDAFRDIIVKAGYKFGIYCGYSWYQNKLPNDAKKYDCWVARYPYADNGTIQERLKPSVGIGWQYSSKGCVSGISGNVDMNVFYKDYSKQEGGSKPMGITKDQAIDALIVCAENEVGYLEKRSNSQLDSKTGNAGTANYTKYWRDLKASYQGQPWCAVFVSWIMYKTFGLETAKKLLKHTSDFPYVYCPTLGARFTKHANPQRGDVVIFYRNGTFAHTGIVTKVQGDRFWTIEGNTSGGSTIIANGGGVCAKSYYNSNLPGTKFCRPDYSIVKSINSPNSTPQVDEPNLITKPLNKTVKFTGTVTASSLNVRLQPSTEAGTCSFSPLKKNTAVNVHDSVNDWYYISYNGKYGFVSAQYISKDTSQKPQNTPQNPSNPSSDKWVGCVYKPSTNVYKAPTGVNPLMEYPKLKNGNLVDVVGEEGSRYKVVISGKYTGYVNKSDIKDSKKEFPYLANVNTNGSTLNLRESPVSGKVIATMPNGSNVIVRKKSTKNGWFEIRYKKQVGYASGDYLKKA